LTVALHHIHIHKCLIEIKLEKNSVGHKPMYIYSSSWFCARVCSCWCLGPKTTPQQCPWRINLASKRVIIYL